MHTLIATCLQTAINLWCNAWQGDLAIRRKAAAIDVNVKHYGGN
jgi:hypothetical protein